MMQLDYEFRDGRLVPIADPMPGDDWEKALTAYGFERYADHGDRIGCEYGAHIQIIGPSHRDVPYQWVCCLTLNGKCMSVWCRDWASLHEYLNYAAPMLTAIQASEIRYYVSEAYAWLFEDEKGIFRDHVFEYHERWRVRREREKGRG